ncbi:MAG: hypothetical protein CNE98_04385 [Bacteroidetes bacterium MED-G17]|nr:MAG: hypothetical protein CBB99_03320 [Bacteroidetes bacterium TMED39]PDH52604.1 MAG: hypothetical protein CNE98_04385 [Bacteroidetes bacterium MED-G17]|tara:strand:- start:8122 stop:8412 length:291 start_codon:yes stop_codon:yes gene_type:complete
MTKNNQKVVTFMVPQEHEEEFVRSVKQILDTYRVQKKNKNLVEQKVFDDVNELKNYLNKLGFKNFRLPSMIHGAFYDKGLTVKKKLENSWEVRVNL